MLLSCFIASIFIVVGFFPTSTPPGGCPRIAIFSQIEANSEKLPEAYTYYPEDNFFEFNKDMGGKGILGQAPDTGPLTLFVAPNIYISNACRSV